jgi:endonuclease/exonuclease/phosphatase family metal-dependent hydrolase
MNAAALNKRLEKKDVAAFVRILKREQVEIVALQNIVRYPGLETRIDAVNEISSQADMRSAFGEMSDNAGRQMGNAVLSSYPIHSNANTLFDGVKSATFEAALHAVIDGGVKEILVFTATLPPKASMEDQAACIRRISAANPAASPYPMIVAGNLPAGESVRKAAGFEDVQAQFATLKNASTRVWYSGPAFHPLSAKTVETEFGTMTIVQFGIFRPTSP